MRVLGAVFLLLAISGVSFGQEITKLIVGDTYLRHLGTSVDLVSLPPPLHGAVIVGAPGPWTLGPWSGQAIIIMPVSGDWTNTTTTMVSASDGFPDDRFGAAVALDGLNALVGAPHNSAVYIYLNGANERIIVPGSPRSDFGRSVAWNGSSIAVGARARAYVFTDTSGGDWSTYSETMIGPPTADDGFGTSIDYEGSTLVVGGSEEAIYVYEGLAPVIIQAFDHDPSEATWFGWSVSLDGSIVAVGAVGDGDGRGAVYLIRDTSPAGDWTVVQQQKISPGDLEEGDDFGASVALEGSNLAVGAAGRDGVNLATGAVYIFKDTSTGGDWSSYSRGLLLASDGKVSDALGHSVALAGDKIVGGAHKYDEPPDNYNGAAYLFSTEALVFEDGFEFGNTSRWSAAVP